MFIIILLLDVDFLSTFSSSSSSLVSDGLSTLHHKRNLFCITVRKCELLYKERFLLDRHADDMLYRADLLAC